MAKKKTGLSQEVTVLGALAEICGKTKSNRADIMKSLWTYIRAKGLQNPKNKRNILAGKDELFLQFCGGKKEVSMFDLAKFVSKFVKSGK